MSSWTGSIEDYNGTAIRDLELSSPQDAKNILLPSASLRFLSLVDTALIPLYMTIGPQFDLKTTNAASESWFSNILLNSADHGNEIAVEEAYWWGRAQLQSPIGILASVGQDNTVSSVPKATELLFFATRRARKEACPPTPPRSSPRRRSGSQDLIDGTGDSLILDLKAIALSSDLLDAAMSVEITPPPSPASEQAHEPKSHFLPLPVAEGAALSGDKATTLKRKSINDTFDEAAKRRKHNKHNIGESIAAAAATHQANHKPRPVEIVPEARKSRPASSTPLQTRPLSRSSSLAGSLPDSRRGSVTTTDAPSKRSGLSTVQSIAQSSTSDATIETRNKDTISRLVMAGMRLYGLSQSKPRSSRRASVAPGASTHEPTQATPVETQVANEEYKLVYHQTLKAAMFAFRASVAVTDLRPYMATLRETVDKLLVMFCTDPLVAAMGAQHGYDEGVTPGGREAFGSSRADRLERDGYFDKPSPGSKEVVETPGMRRKGGQDK